MAYILGFICADGSLEDASYLRGKYLRIYNTDYYIINEIKHRLGSEHKIVPSSPKGKRKVLYMLRIGSHEIFQDLSRLNIHPNKSLNMEIPIIPEKYFNSFLRGYFDGDGCIYIEKQKNNLKIIFTSGSKSFLDDLSELISNYFSINPHRVFNSHRSYQLKYCQKDSLKIFRYIYKNTENGLYLTRKRDKYQNFLKQHWPRTQVV
ncbi:MAG: LAGLIDADG family homing endonuclease [bacterium]